MLHRVRSEVLQTALGPSGAASSGAASPCPFAGRPARGRIGRREPASAGRASGGRDPSRTGREAPRREQAGRRAGEKNDPQFPTIQETPPQENHTLTASQKPMNPRAQEPLKRGWPAQRQRREADRVARRRAVAFDRWARHSGLTRHDAAGHLGVARSTLAHWERQWREEHLAAHPRGRSCHRGDRQTRNAAIHLMTILGPHTGLATLRAALPTLARGEIQDLQRRFRRLWRRDHRRLLRVLHWHHPGTIWAMDHTEPPCAIDGRWRHILAVRDLASRMQLGWLPVASEGAARDLPCLGKPLPPIRPAAGPEIRQRLCVHRRGHRATIGSVGRLPPLLTAPHSTVQWQLRGRKRRHENPHRTSSDPRRRAGTMDCRRSPGRPRDRQSHPSPLGPSWAHTGRGLASARADHRPSSARPSAAPSTSTENRPASSWATPRTNPWTERPRPELTVWLSAALALSAAYLLLPGGQLLHHLNLIL